MFVNWLNEITWTTFISFLTTFSLMKWCLIAICFVRSWNTRFSKSLITHWLLHISFVGSLLSMICISARNFFIQMPSFAPLVSTIYFTSVNDKAMQGCFLLPQVMRLDPSLKTYLEVDFLSCKSPTQLALKKSNEDICLLSPIANPQNLPSLWCSETNA